MNRRGFLTGLLASVAVPPSAAVYVLRTTIAPGPVYGLSPGMMALPEMDMIQAFAAAQRLMIENTRKLWDAPAPVAFKNTFENGQFVSRAVSAAEFYK